MKICLKFLQKLNYCFQVITLKIKGIFIKKNVIGLQFHFEPLDNNVKEIVVNDYPYIDGSVLNQSKEQIINKAVPKENKQIMFQLLDYITAHSN